MKSLMPKIDSKDGLFHNGNPATGEQGTRVKDVWLNDVQDRVRDLQAEAHYVLSKAGFKPKAESQTQLYESIVKIIDDNRRSASTTQKGEVQLTDDTGLDSDKLGLTARAGKKLAQLIASVQTALGNYIHNNKKSSSVNSNSNDTVATSAAVKVAYDKGVKAETVADNANRNANGRVMKTGDTMTGNLTVPNLIVNDQANNNNFIQIGDDTKLIDVDISHTVGLQNTDNTADAYIAFGSANKKFGFDGTNFRAESGMSAQWHQTGAKGHGSFSSQWLDKSAPYVVNNHNANGNNTYFPFLKGFNSNGNLYGTAFSLGYMTPGQINQFGSGVIHLIADNGVEKYWWFDHDGTLRADDVVAKNKKLSKSHQSDEKYVDVESQDDYGGLRIRKPDGKLMIFEREGNRFKYWAEGMYEIFLPEKTGTALLDSDVTYQRIDNFEIRKYPDGTMIQTYFIEQNDLKDWREKSFNWAQAFVDTPMILGGILTSLSGSHACGLNILKKSNHATCYYWEYEVGGEYQGDVRLQFSAIGRWK